MSSIVACLLSFVMIASAQARSLPDFTELVEELKPAVVNISTSQDAGSRRSSDRGSDPRQQMPELFRRFFGDDMFPHRQGPDQRGKRSLGSGFIVSKDGYILTNNHVVEDADHILVRLIDRRELEAELIGSDARSDLALLKIDAKDLPVVKLGNSDNLKVGEWVMAIGSPFGFDYSVTAGIVSAIDRSLPSDNYVPFIQTDVAINPGNSGGPLFNMDGEVVGINSQIYTRSGGFMGLSFAIPMSVAMDVVDQLKEKGHVSRGWLGVVIQEVNKELAESFGLKKAAGALVAEVLEDSPAQAAGLREGDIITKFGDKEIELSADLPHVVGTTKAGSKVPIQIVRNGTMKTLTVKVGDLPDDPEQLTNKKPGNERVNRLGMTVAELTEQIQSKSGINEGVIILQVERGDAAQAGLRRGDIITMLDGKQVVSTDVFEDLVDGLEPGKAVPVRIVRNGRPIFLPLKVTK
ncbi:MAG: DegQ family serine endoprotease [Pseudomonadales bacterium]|nr:DegQ family serine endoprotease [Pseudomonadales bacterium]